MDEDDSSSTDDLISALASNATSAYETTAALNANPLNTALLYGGTASTAQGTTSASSLTTSLGGSGTWLLLIAIAIIGFILFADKR